MAKWGRWSEAEQSEGEVGGVGVVEKSRCVAATLVLHYPHPAHLRFACAPLRRGDPPHKGEGRCKRRCIRAIATAADASLVPLLIRAIELVVIVLMGTVTALIIAEVALRWLGTSLIVTDELSRYLMIWTAMLAATVLVYEDGHLRTTLLPDSLPPRAARAVYLLCDVVTLSFLGTVAGASVALIVAIKEQNTITLGVSMLWFYAALPVCATMMFCLTLRAMILRLRRPL